VTNPGGLNQAIAFGRHLHAHESTWSQFNATDLRWDSTKSAIVDPEFDPMLVYFVAGVTFHSDLHQLKSLNWGEVERPV
jgi:hypothetical protein